VRERGQTDGLNQLLLCFTENTEEIHRLAVKVVESFHRRRVAIEQHRDGTGERLALMVTSPEQRQQPVEMREFPAMSAEWNELLFLQQPRDWQGADRPCPEELVALVSD
jgi:hypothetical protein